MKKPLAAAILWAVSLASMAADSAPASGPATPNWLAQARQAIEAKNYDLAVTVLNQSDQKSSADWHNLMGYSLRKKTPPDLPAAEKNYQMALEKDPKHRGALEYYGELKVLQGDLAGARRLLARLDQVCTFGCPEAEELRRWIATGAQPS